MAQQKYLIQSKLPSWNLYGGYSESQEIMAVSDSEAIEKGRQHLQERKRLGQDETGFRILKLVHEETA